MIPTRYYQKDDVMRAAKGRWPDVLGRLGVQSGLLENKHGPCPGCGGRDRFRWDDKDGEGTWLCSQGGGGTISGDGLALLMHVTGKEWKECLNMVGEVVLGDAGLRTGRAESAMNAGVAKAPARERETWVPEFDYETLAAAARVSDEKVNEEWFMERSPVDVRGLASGEFLEHLYGPGERVLVFTEFRSQGDFLWEVGKGGYRLGAAAGVRAVRSALPVDGGKDGVWFLNQPVDAQWHGNPRNGGKPSRRSEEAVTAWRYLVLECDEEKTYRKKAGALKDALGKSDPEAYLAQCITKKWAAEMMLRRAEWPALAELLYTRAPLIPRLWMRMLAMCGLPIAAIYSSGGASLHALVREPAGSAEEFKEKLRAYKKRVPKLGADPAAITHVRLTRLPSCTRGGRMQRLIYLNPKADPQKVNIINQFPKKRVL
jgi:hypothetical protein